MKLSLLILVIILFITGIRQKNPDRNVTQQNRKSTVDTVFISREITKDYYHVVYIEKNRSSRSYKNLLNFNMNDDELKGYKENCQALKKHYSSPLKKFHFGDFPREWMPLYRYKGKYYIYYPSEWGFIGRSIITDSSLVYWSMELPFPNPIVSMKQINKNTWHLITKSYYSNTAIANYIIHIIDPVNKIAVWEETNPTGTNRFKLRIPKATAKNFDMIVNYCEQNKTDEVIFDNIDYKALLKSR